MFDRFKELEKAIADMGKCERCKFEGKITKRSAQAQKMKCSKC